MENKYLKPLVKVDRLVEKCIKIMQSDYSCCLQKLPTGDEIWFIPYTTDIPQLKKGVIEFDSMNNTKFIAYDGYICDDGNWHLGTVNSFKISNDELYLINKKLKEIHKNTKIDEQNTKDYADLYNKYYSKEQECQELKNKIKYMEEYIKTVENARNEFEKESKFLKEENAEIRKFLQQQLDQLKAENEKLDTENKRLVAERLNPVFDSIEELDKLKQTLVEIKKIAEKEVNNRMLFADKESFCDFNKILQKINECEEKQ